MTNILSSVGMSRGLYGDEDDNDDTCPTHTSENSTLM
jgi:hypothetical protein